MQYKDVTAKPTPPPMAHRLSPAVDLYNRPVAVPANTVFASSSSPRANCSSTPNAEYITVMQPSVFAVAEPCFIKWFKSLRKNRTENRFYQNETIKVMIQSERFNLLSSSQFPHLICSSCCYNSIIQSSCSAQTSTNLKITPNKINLNHVGFYTNIIIQKVKPYWKFKKKIKINEKSLKNRI